MRLFESAFDLLDTDIQGGTFFLELFKSGHSKFPLRLKIPLTELGTSLIECAGSAQKMESPGITESIQFTLLLSA